MNRTTLVTVLLLVSLTTGGVTLLSVLRATQRLRQQQSEGQFWMEQAARQRAEQEQSALCWKAVKPLIQEDGEIDYQTMYGQAPQATVGVCFATRAECERTWDQKDTSQTTWQGYCREQSSQWDDWF